MTASPPVLSPSSILPPPSSNWAFIPASKNTMPCPKILLFQFYLLGLSYVTQKLHNSKLRVSPGVFVLSFKKSGSDCPVTQQKMQSSATLHSAVRLPTGPQLLPKPVLRRLPSAASYLNSQYRLFSLWSSSNCLHLLPRLPVTFILLPIFPSITCCIRQSLSKM
jgi:hypothetical protein